MEQVFSFLQMKKKLCCQSDDLPAIKAIIEYVLLNETQYNQKEIFFILLDLRYFYFSIFTKPEKLCVIRIIETLAKKSDAYLKPDLVTMLGRLFFNSDESERSIILDLAVFIASDNKHNKDIMLRFLYFCQDMPPNLSLFQRTSLLAHVKYFQEQETHPVFSAAARRAESHLTERVII